MHPTSTNRSLTQGRVLCAKTTRGKRSGVMAPYSTQDGARRGCAAYFYSSATIPVFSLFGRKVFYLMGLQLKGCLPKARKAAGTPAILAFGLDSYRCGRWDETGCLLMVSHNFNDSLLYSQ